jgi:L-threonylcarbamoyladenylate synthase
MRIVPLNSHDSLEQALAVLHGGGVVVAPTDTVYGLLVDAKNEQAIDRLLRLKSRPVGKAISVFVDGFEMMDQLVDTSQLTPAVRAQLPGSYTLVMTSKHAVSQKLEAEDGTLGVRLIGAKSSLAVASDSEKILPADWIRSLVGAFGRPITATSANVSGKSVCRNTESFLNQLSDERRALVDLIVDAGELPFAHPSTVLDLTSQTPQVIRSSFHHFAKRDVHTSQSEKDTQGIAQKLLERIGPSAPSKAFVVLLHGELGAGKTTFVKGFAKGVGAGDVVSPTYTYEAEYVLEGGLFTHLHHYDLYNLKYHDDLYALHIERNCLPRRLVCIEWSEKLDENHQTILNKNANVIDVMIEYQSETTRQITIAHNLL